ncbi:histidine kinase [Alkalihalobacillus sp. BA299]|uniref:sensor histidine kinase n=1 Tax=Alkalihalobacillus sp. BA299 TaxID=2815938 RepID=UPI001ADA1A47|nr:histidine kinase [Alkalihalobacillus sp. BA299]
MLKSSIRNKLIVLLLLITIIPFGTSIIVTFFYTKESLKNQSVQENVNLLFQGKINIETYIRELNNFTLSFYNNAEFLNYLKKQNDVSNYMSTGVVHYVLNSLLYSDQNINKVSILMEKDPKLISVSKRSTIVYSEHVDDRLVKAYLKAQEDPTNLYIESTNGSKEVTLHRVFRDVPADDILAYISIQIRTDKVDELSKNLYHHGLEDFYVLTREGQFIYQSRKLVNKDENQWMHEILESGTESGTIEWKDESFHGVMIYDTTSDSTGGLILVKRIPFTSLYESAYGVAIINIIFGIIGLTLVIFATFFVSYKITSPITVLMQNIREIEKGNMKAQFQSLGNDEIGILGDRFKQMINKINQLINREYKLQLENKTNQLKVLYSQINPHFLYNTLQSIGTLALKRQVPEIYTSLTDLSQIMRYSMNMDEDIVPLHKEINYTKSYLLLQKQRFGEELDYCLDIEESALDISVPKMLLQPIIENYFKHGFDVREGIGQIRIKCKKIDSMLLIQIRDNGKGVTEQKLHEILQHLNADHNNGKGESSIGLKNVYTRLKLYYSDKSTLELKNLEQGGFLVIIKIPIEMEVNHESNFS